MSHEPGHIEEPQVTDYKALYEKYYNAGMTFDDASNKLLDYYGAGTLEIEALNTFYESKKKVKTELQPRSPIRKRFLRNLPQVQLLRENKRVEVRFLL